MHATDLRPTLAVSIVSHGHGPLVQELLLDLAQHSGAGIARVILTLNIPEPPPQAPTGGWPFVLELRHNTHPLGFGPNHNRALAGATEPFVCILNPDVKLHATDPFPALMQTAAQTSVGCAYPLQLDAQGRHQDSERSLPSPWQVLRRRLRCHPAPPATVEWVNGACLVLRRSVWQALGGFDEGYFMYGEDVDLCLRLRLQGLQLARAPAHIEHTGQRASRRAWRPFWWHVRSLMRLWRSPVYKAAQQLRHAPEKTTTAS